jgi:hypothetical protein
VVAFEGQDDQANSVNDRCTGVVAVAAERGLCRGVSGYQTVVATASPGEDVAQERRDAAAIRQALERGSGALQRTLARVDARVELVTQDR